MDRFNILSWLLFFTFGFLTNVGYSQYNLVPDTINLPNFNRLTTFNTISHLNYKTAAMDVQTFDANHLPLFCKIEHQIEKTSKIAFRFRLGDLNYVNMLENK